MKNLGKSIALALLMTPSFASSSEAPVAVVRAFYKLPVVLGAGGIPTQHEIGAISRFLANDLASIIRLAKDFEVECAKVTTSQIKPPVWEGGFFSWNTEGATRLVSAREIVAGESATVAITLEHVDESFPVGHRYRIHAWTLDVELVKTGDRWVIADVIDEQGSTMKEELYEFSSVRCDA